MVIVVKQVITLIGKKSACMRYIAYVISQKKHPLTWLIELYERTQLAHGLKLFGRRKCSFSDTACKLGSRAVMV